LFVATLSSRGTSFAEAIADALAIIHWEAGVDGRDIESVTGSAPSETAFLTVRPAMQRFAGFVDRCELDTSYFGILAQSARAWACETRAK